MGLLYINTGTTANSGNGDNLRSAFTKVNSMFSELYAVSGISASSVPDSSAQIWLNPTDHYGIAYYYNTSTHLMHSTLLPASAGTLGGVKIGSGINIDSNGVISVPPTYTLPVATTSTLGGVRQGVGINIDPASGRINNAGVLSIDGRTGAVTLGPSDITNALGYTPVSAASVGQPNGVASLDSSGKIPASELSESVLGALNYQGTWNANTNSPQLTSGHGIKGGYYKVSFAGTTNLDGIATWNVGDLAIFNGTNWDKIDGIAAEVTSVAGRTGDVTLTYADISGNITRSAFSATSTATNTQLGTVRIGAGIYVSSTGTISVDQTLVTPASTSTLGVVRVGAGLSITPDGTLAANVTGTGAFTFIANQIGTTGTNDLVLAPASGIVRVVNSLVAGNSNNAYVLRTSQFLNAGLATDATSLSLRIVGDLSSGSNLFDAGYYNSPSPLTAVGWTSKFLVSKTGDLTMQGNLTVKGSGGIKFPDGSIQTKAAIVLTATNVTVGGVIVGNGLAIDSTGVLSLAQGSTGGTISSLGPQTIASSSNPGSPGQVAWDGSYLYLCVSVNSWIRIALANAGDVPGGW